MSLEHSPARSRSDAARTSREIIPDHDADQVLSFAAWCRLNGFSQSTGIRILKGPPTQRPKFIQMSARRIGITKGENRRWQASRVR